MVLLLFLSSLTIVIVDMPLDFFTCVTVLYRATITIFFLLMMALFSIEQLNLWASKSLTTITAHYHLCDTLFQRCFSLIMCDARVLMKPYQEKGDKKWKGENSMNVIALLILNLEIISIFHLVELIIDDQIITLCFNAPIIEKYKLVILMGGPTLYMFIRLTITVWVSKHGNLEISHSILWMLLGSLMKEILDLMNTPGLTRMQVSSHLQKFQNDNWRSPDERKSHQSSPQASSDINMYNYKPRRFGSMHLLSKEQSKPRSSSETETVNKGENGKNGLPLAAYEHPPQPRQARGGRRHPSYDFFSFTDMDFLVQNYLGLPQGSVMNPQASRASPYHLDQVYIQQVSNEN